MKVIFIFSTLLVTTMALNAEDLELDYNKTEQLAGLPLECISREYPNKLSQLLKNESFLLPPSELHPIFYGCYDWHSSVHGHWLLSKVVNLFPEGEVVGEILENFRHQFQAEKVEEEVSYFDHDPYYERTYGWTWLLKLQEELEKSSNTELNGFGEELKPLAQLIVEFFKDYLPKLVYPIRVGTHSNTAFGLSFALDYARHSKNAELEDLILHNATQFYREDRSCPLNYEPSGHDFLSPCLQEADLMTRVIGEKEEFAVWLENFLPELFDEDFDLEPGVVIDHTDAQLVHLDGINFSRAWALFNIAIKMPETLGNRLIAMADNHINASINFVVGSDYVGSHWLASFLMYALEKRKEAVEAVNALA